MNNEPSEAYEVRVYTGTVLIKSMLYRTRDRAEKAIKDIKDTDTGNLCRVFLVTMNYEL